MENTNPERKEPIELMPGDAELLHAAIRRLQEENATLRRDVSDVRKRLAEAQGGQVLMQLKMNLANHNAEQMMVKYQTLASSKLGKLTRKIWAIRSHFHAVCQSRGTLAGLRWLLTPAAWAEKEHQDAKMRDAQVNWIDEYINRIVTMPDSNGFRYYEKLSCRVGLICDNFFYDSIRSAADFVILTPDNWKDELGKGLDAMLFVTAWRGLHEEWRGLGTASGMSRNPMRLQALKLLDECRDRKIPTVFYSKEDPPNYEVFLDYAMHCDYVCTTAEECVPLYRAACRHDRVRTVCFGINPVAHNPIGFYAQGKEKTVLFSGSWMQKYPNRCKELSMIFDGVLQSDYKLHIVDRNYPGNPQYAFPESYFPYTSPALPHDLLQKTHKLFDWAININSVKESRTMFANRAYELQANGVLLLSNLSVGVNRLLPNVQMVLQCEEATAILNAMPDEDRYERQLAGIRSVMSGHTCFDRIREILEPLGIDARQPERKILVLADVLNRSVQDAFNRQTYLYKELRTAGSISAGELSQFDMVAWFDTHADYGVFYLEDMANGFKYTACDYITKDAWYESGVLHAGVEHNYVNRVGSKYRTLFWRAAFSPQFLLNLSGEQFLENGYSIDRFQFDMLPKNPEEQAPTYRLSIIVPVQNNGPHLYGKAFSSLRRSSLFPNMEILLIDCGSTDDFTVKIVLDLERRYANIRMYPLDRKLGSPLSQGAQIASAAYVALLEPESESLNDGYAAMLEQIEQQSADMAVGNLYLAAADAQLEVLCPLAGNPDGLEKAIQAAPWKMQGMLLRAEAIRKNLEADRTLRISALAQQSCAVNKPVAVRYTA